MNRKVKLLLLFVLIISYELSAEMIYIQKSDYVRNLSDGKKQEVHLDSFFVSDSLVTVKEWNDFLSETATSENKSFWNRKLISILDVKDKNIKINKDWPTYYISFDEVIAYCNWRSIKEALVPVYSVKIENGITKTTLNPNANGYRLLSKAEWQYLSGVGLSDKALNKDELLKKGAFVENSKGDFPVKICSFCSNAFGIFDLIGTMNEFLWDFYDEDDYTLEVWNPLGSNKYIPDEDQVFFNEPLSERRFVTNGSFCTYVDSLLNGNYFYGATSIEKGFISFRLAKNE